ncbi:MAG: hypothetical protein ACREQ5_26610, partial [Candidatus Dormibacteria bacterium]
MVNLTSVKKILAAMVLACLFCAPSFAQQQSDGQHRPSEQSRSEFGAPRTPDLGQENLDRVAASATQIRGILVGDEGLMVELKRWVAKEATDNGQVVEDASLTD